MPWGEFILILALLVVLFALRNLFGPPLEPHGSPIEDLKLWFAQGFGIGRIPFAPGTFGSALGIAWFALLVSRGRVWIFAAGTLAGLLVAVWLSGAAEKTLRRKDPGSVVVDEIAALPVCYCSWVAIFIDGHGAMPDVDDFFSARTWPLNLGIFAAFRFFDVLKPWPVRQSQKLPGGWGVTIDDFLAAIYVNLLMLLVFATGLIQIR